MTESELERMIARENRIESAHLARLAREKRIAALVWLALLIAFLTGVFR